MVLNSGTQALGHLGVPCPWGVGGRCSSGTIYKGGEGVRSNSAILKGPEHAFLGKVGISSFIDSWED